ncbi:MAG: FliH/SctL family protein [Burkholderiaceae bacterium]|nr:FliH/SctL family protein [Burkholderiaceae bacterium]
MKISADRRLAGCRVIKKTELVDLSNAKGILDAAHSQRNHLLAQAQAEGKLRADEAVRQALAHSATRQAEIVTETLAWRSRILNDLEDEIFDLVAELARKLCLESAGRDRIVAATRKALGALSASRQAVIIVHPDDLAWVQAELASIRERYPLLDALRFEPQTAQARGVCTLSSELGQVTVSLPEQLDAILKRMRDTVSTTEAP